MARGQHFRPEMLSSQYRWHSKNIRGSLPTSLCSFTLPLVRKCYSVTEFYPENELKLIVDTAIRQPDCAFSLHVPRGERYQKMNFLIEVDCGTEPLRSARHRESLERKIQFYERYQDAQSKRFRVVFFFTSRLRLENFVELLGKTNRRKDRQLIYAGVAECVSRRTRCPSLGDCLRPSRYCSPTRFCTDANDKFTRT